jgi:glycosyltransferase involved in cell wall biosynthesis
VTLGTGKAAPERIGAPLRIGMVAPPWFEVPPVGYGGTEAVVASLVDGLSAGGHEVTLIASGRRHPGAARQSGAYDIPPSELLGASVMPELIQAAEAARVLAELDLDVVHDHSAAGPLLARGRAIPTLSTMHGPADGENLAYLARLGRSIDLVAISDAQRRAAPGLNWVGTVHNAVDVPSFPFSEHKGDELLWIGRFCPDKGPHHAIDAARAAGRRILLAGKLREKPELEFFDREVRPRLGPAAEYVGEADATVKRELFARAACLVFPISWDEPFGMVMAEAMACGTPVVATRRGSVPEVVEDGVTGIVVDRLDELPAAIDRAVALRPADCRARAETRFDLPVMVAGYERIYRVLVEGSASIRRLTAEGAGDAARGVAFRD